MSNRLVRNAGLSVAVAAAAYFGYPVAPAPLSVSVTTDAHTLSADFLSDTNVAGRLTVRVRSGAPHPIASRDSATPLSVRVISSAVGEADSVREYAICDSTSTGATDCSLRLVSSSRVRVRVSGSHDISPSLMSWEVHSPTGLLDSSKRQRAGFIQKLGAVATSVVGLLIAFLWGEPLNGAKQRGEAVAANEGSAEQGPTEIPAVNIHSQFMKPLKHSILLRYAIQCILDKRDSDTILKELVDHGGATVTAASQIVIKAFACINAYRDSIRRR